MLIEHDKHGRMPTQYITEEQIQAGWRVVEPEPIKKAVPVAEPVKRRGRRPK
jgi:hypothetical protein